jgi:23S rRNA pseudouridine2605 synthase
MSHFNPPNLGKQPGVVSLCRALSKLGYCSRSAAEELIKSGHVKVNGRVETNPATRINLGSARLEAHNVPIGVERKIYLMLNKPRGLVTTTSDEQGRNTVYSCVKDHGLPWLPPVGRLDKASEGLLLFTNDSAWASGLLDPAGHISRTYHVQIRPPVNDSLIEKLSRGIDADGEILTASRISVLRSGEKTSWLEIVLHEGKNRHIRRMLETCGVEVERLIRIAIGDLKLGNLRKGDFRFLDLNEIHRLTSRRPK